MTTEALPVLADLRERFLESEEKLTNLATVAGGPHAAIRLAGKAAGVALARSYLDEAIRGLGE